MTMNLNLARRPVLSATSLALAAAVALAACGGGGGDNTVPETPVPTQSLTLHGTAAVGAPIVGQAVSVRCAVGTGSTVTGTDGSYSVVIPSGAWPCMAQVPALGNVLTTIASTTGTSAIANITPATHLIVAALTGTDPGPYFLTFGITSAASITLDAIAIAERSMIARLLAAGVDFSPIGDLLASVFTPSYDAVLVALGTRLTASGMTLSQLTTSIANASAPSAISIPTNLLLQPAAANCGALRSTTYRILTPKNGAPLSAQFGVMTLNATSLAVTHPDQSTGTWVANGACRFTEQNGSYSADITVTQAGLLVARYTTDGTTFRSYLGFPEQTHALAELAGTWNVLGMTRVSSTTYAGTAGTLTYDDHGAVTGATNCQNNATWAIDACVTVNAALLAGVVPLVADGAGGFDITDPTSLAVTGRMFVFEPGSGDLMLANVSDEGELFISAPIKSVSVPAVASASNSWNFDNLASFLSASPVYVTSTTVTSVDTASASWTRSHTATGSTAVRSETLFANVPRIGFVHRPSAIVTDSTGALVTVNEFTSMSVPGTGFSPLFLTTGTKLFELSTRLP